jgi:hypothetical protein
MHITILFTRRRWNLVSWLIRWAMPRSRFAWALSSHALIVDGGFCYEAVMLGGVRCVSLQAVLKNQQPVRELRYTVPDATAGIAWVQTQIGRPYDFKGAFGLALAPGRNWADDDCWFCYELAAGVLKAAGRPEFANLSHIGETALFSIAP